MWVIGPLVIKSRKASLTDLGVKMNSLVGAGEENLLNLVGIHWLRCCVFDMREAGRDRSE